jgi:hypothetical protein
MTTLSLLFVTLLIVWATFFELLPRVGRDLSRHALLRYRGRLYRLAERQPHVRTTQLYRDLEFLLTWGCHMVETNQFLPVLLNFGEKRRPRRDTTRFTARRRRIDRELSEIDGTTMIEFVQILDGTHTAMIPFLVLHNPFMLVFMLVLAPLVVLSDLARKLRAKPTQTIDSVERLYHPRHRAIA